MAKIKIQGNASGTGVVTLTAPNTNSDRTITLPDSTTTLATVENFTSTGIDDNATSTAITIDSSENVKLVGDEQELRFHSNYSIGNTDRAKIKAIGAGGGSGYGGDLTFHTKNPSNVYSERMRIDSAGRVTMPYQPAFCSSKANNSNYPAYTALDWTTTYNQGNHFNGKRFTAPVSGIYHFSYGGVTHGVSDYFYIGFIINGSNNTQPASGSWRHLPSSTGEYNNMHTSLTVYLYVGDYIEAATGFNGGTPYLESGRSSFSGHLIG